MPVFLPLLAKVLDAVLGAIAGNRADAVLSRLGGDGPWVERAASVVAAASPVRLKRKQWVAVLRDQAMWHEIVSAAAELATDAAATPTSIRRIAAMLPSPGDNADEDDRVEAAALLVLAVLLEASPEARASMATVPAIAKILSDGEFADRRRADREAREALPLRRSRLRRPAGIRSLSPSGLLVADYGVVPFVDRAGLLDRLATWCRSPSRCSVAVVTGEGGAGKTRLALELCRRVATFPAPPGGKRWATGVFVRSAGTDGARLIAAFRAPRLVVIDYAEAAPIDAAELIVALDRHASLRNPARIVLLIRHGTTAPSSLVDTPWPWLARRDATVREYLLSAVAEQSVMPLERTPLTLNDRSRLFDSASAVFALARDQNAPAISAPAWLTETQYGSPLVVSLAALTCVLEGGVVRDSMSTPDLLNALLDHEARYWEATRPVSDLETETLGVAASLATAFRPENEQAAMTLLRVAPDLSEERDVVVRRVARWLSELYPNHDSPTSSVGAIGAVQPDRVGEALVAQTVTDGRLLPARLLSNGLRHVSAGSTRSCFEFLARAAPPRPELDPRLEELSSDLPNMARDVLAERGQRAVEWLGAVVDGAQRLSARLADAGRDTAALAISSAALESVLAIADDESMSERLAAIRVIAANAVSNCLAHAGRATEALARAQEAAAWASELVAGEADDEKLPVWAGALANLSLRFREVQDLENAVAVAQKSIAAYRRIATDGDPRHRADLALALNNTSVLMTDASKPDSALEMAQQAVELYEALADEQGFDAPAEMGAALTNLANRLADAQRPDEAVIRAEAAVSVYRRLVVIHDQAFEGLTDRFPSPHQCDLAASLHNLAVWLAQAGDPLLAGARGKEAVDLADETGTTHSPEDRALWFNDLAGWLTAAGRPDEGCAVYARSIDAYETLADKDPVGRDRWFSLQGRARNDQAVALTEAERFPEATVAAHQAWKDLLELAIRVPSSASDAISTLVLYSSCAERTGSFDEALTAIDTTLTWLGQRGLEGVDHLVELVGGLQALGQERREINDDDGATEMSKRIVVACQLIRIAAPDRLTPEISNALTALQNDAPRLAGRAAVDPPRS